ncbi:hypothetical protein KR067_006009 [Drosophila pandora]|nr:hypothetical protein KR067_006009 [Drosophila pandora]
MSIMKKSVWLEELGERSSSWKRAFSMQYTKSMNLEYGRVPRHTDGKIHILYEARISFLGNKTRRHPEDSKYMGEFNETWEPWQFYFYYPKDDDRDVMPRDPSYAKFKVSMNAVCSEKISERKKQYNSQINREIEKLIEYQSSAVEAAYLVRLLSYTSFWPPYHTKEEIEKTSKTFFKLSKKEKRRYDYIMSHEFN